jgi:hypothetical protein
MPAINEQLCRTICQTASAMGFRLRREETRGLTAFIWRTPSGDVLRAGAKAEPRAALTTACELLADILL